jgi:CBS domain-containing protein
MNVPATASAEVLVEHAMNPGVIACARETPLSDVARMMAEHSVHAIVVVDGGERELWGVVSDLDLAAAAGVRDLREQTAGASAATPVLMVPPQESLRRAAQLMTEHAIAHLVVVDPGSGRPVGVLSTLDVARVLGWTGDANR